MSRVLLQSAEAHLKQAELALDHPERCSTFARMLALRCSLFRSRVFARLCGNFPLACGSSSFPSPKTYIWKQGNVVS